MTNSTHTTTFSPLNRNSGSPRLKRCLSARVPMLVDPSALDRIIDHYENRVGPRHGAKVVAKCWVDREFRPARRCWPTQRRQ